MTTRHGYTLVELLIIISITAILMTFIFSGYSKATERQTIQQAKEQLLSSLQSFQKSAYVGNKDCSGTLSGVRVTFTANSMTGTPECESGTTGTPKVYTYTNFSFTPVPPDFIFKPLEQGIVFSSGNSEDITYTIAGKKYRIRVENPGRITYEGLIP